MGTLCGGLHEEEDRTRKCISCRKCSDCWSTKWGWKYFLIKPQRLRHKETLNGLNQVKGFEQKFKSLHAHHLRKSKWLETNEGATEWKGQNIAKNSGM